MPIKKSQLKETTLAVHRHMSYEQLLAAWLLSDGWEVLIPVLDHGKKTDLVIADDSNFYRIQVKCLDTADDSIIVSNQWKDKKIDYVIYFSLKHEWDTSQEHLLRVIKN